MDVLDYLNKVDYVLLPGVDVIFIQVFGKGSPLMYLGCVDTSRL